MGQYHYLKGCALLYFCNYFCLKEWDEFKKETPIKMEAVQIQLSYCK